MTNRGDDGITGRLVAADGKLFAVMPGKRVELRESVQDLQDWCWDLARLVTLLVEYIPATDVYAVGGKYLHPCDWGQAPQRTGRKGGTAGKKPATRTSGT